MFGRFYKRLSKNKLAVAGLIVVAILFAVAIGAPILSPYAPDDIDTTNILAPPTRAHLLGTDILGPGTYSHAMIYGSRVSLSVGFVAVGISTLIGAFLGSISGYYRGIPDIIIMRFVDIMLCFPSFFSFLQS